MIICEDNLVQREFIYKEIMNYTSFHEPSIELVLCTNTPDEVLSYLNNYQADCYFLDIELDHQLDGMELAMEIRKKDPLATIIFITTHADRLKLTFTYKLAALDFIVKDTPDQIATQVKEALQAAFEKYIQFAEVVPTELIQINIGERIKNIALQDIYFFETSTIPHKLTLYEKNGFYEFYGRLKDFEEVNPSFYRCHKSFLINLQHVKELDKKKRTVTMSNGAICVISFRAFRELQSRLSAY
ncbi:LytTR family DNA-binding domain-containing protein [Sporosarcina sp. GW1-11]|uniref:LytR/AlgR family response regulator transcription factor n=1 Tax=Sporosarcina sp. GW1-11 TaxID=2899126 RepID=UPI002954E191|nr:LytTR family DNA-binding domain-containing protein [Sporosarcina sp. GW1-11]